MADFDISPEQVSVTFESTEELIKWLQQARERADSGDLGALFALREVLQATQHVQFSRELFTYVPANSAQRLTCMMPHNQHFISTWKNFKCTHDPNHIFCARHALSLCPICGNTVK